MIDLLIDLVTQLRMGRRRERERERVGGGVRSLSVASALQAFAFSVWVHVKGFSSYVGNANLPVCLPLLLELTGVATSCRPAPCL